MSVISDFHMNGRVIFCSSLVLLFSNILSTLLAGVVENACRIKVYSRNDENDSDVLSLFTSLLSRSTLGLQFGMRWHFGCPALDLVLDRQNKPCLKPRTSQPWPAQSDRKTVTSVGSQAPKDSKNIKPGSQACGLARGGVQRSLSRRTVCVVSLELYKLTLDVYHFGCVSLVKPSVPPQHVHTHP